MRRNNMSDFLRRYVGTYRVKAHYDLETNDFPKGYDNTIDNNFDDYYISCNNNGEIKHISYTSNLMYYNEKISVVYRILKALIKHELGIEATTRAEVEKNMSKLKLVYNIDLMDSEGCFDFKAENLAELAGFLKPHTSGKSISPLSPKNLPKAPYEIPAKDMDTYKKATNAIGCEGIEKMRIINDINNAFKKDVLGDEYLKEQRKLALGFKEFIHTKGLWNKYVDYIEQNIK
jgi:hypothetical protein